MAPPYDVISAEQQDQLYERSPYNVIRLELGRAPDRYAEAREAYTAWRRDGVLRADPASMYLYEQRFRTPAASGAAASTSEPGQVRRGIVARVRLEEWSAGVVLPHEDTLTKAKADRLELMRAIWANVSPIFSLYDDPKRELANLLSSKFAEKPLAEGTDDANEDHRLWQIPAGELTGQIRDFFADRQLFIADGHHRYETSLALRQEARAQDGRYPGADYVMMVLVDFADPGLAVLPTHRLLHNLGPSLMQTFSQRLGDYFDVVAVAENPSPRALQATLQQLDRTEGPAFALYGPLPSGLRLLALKPQWRNHSFQSQHSDAWNRLDVAVLHAVIGGEILGLNAEDLTSQRYFEYTHDATQALRGVSTGEHQLALLLRGTPASAIRDISLANDKMPQKSTYFYPKLGTGLVINPLDL